MKKEKNTKILVSDYKKLLTEIKKQIAQTKNKIVQKVTRQKIEMAWQIGKLVDENLSKNSELGYGKYLLEQLEQDVGITHQVLYKMRSFYKTYKKLPRDEAHLNWSHYRVLAGIKKTDERKYLEDLTRQNGWDGNRLQLEVSKSRISQIRVNKDLKAISTKPKKLIPARGKLFSYPIATLAGSEKYFFDCGFGIFKEVDGALPKEVRKENQIVAVEKKSENYAAKKSAIHPKKLYAYKAKLDRVVDGDTIRVVLDLGFKIFHKEILRLKGIDAPEIDSAAGKKSSKILSEILQDVPFLIIKSIRTDVYGRYVADVFLAEKNNPKSKLAGAKLVGEELAVAELTVESDPQKVADEGVYLNQLLLDRGAVSLVE
jgi:hypothetical protein